MPENRMDGEFVGGGPLVVGCEPVPLEPFVHQVGGHSGMFSFDESTVCKPLIPREHKFYEAMPKCMRRFTPEYRGTVEVSCRQDSEGYLSLLAHPVSSLSKELSAINSGGEEARSDSDSENSGPRAGGSSKQRFRIQRSGSIEVEGVASDCDQTESDKEHQILSVGLKPWSLRCHKQQIARMHQSLQQDDSAHKFILLENLASQFEFPCILDLKMGRRQHGDNATEQKRLHQTRKCKNSTSSSLGTRISGMQVYQSDTCHFLCHSKYYGRQLDERGVGEALKQFLHNGHKLRLDLLDPLIDKLTQLKRLLEQQNTFRFYSSSLLIMYDGDEGSAAKQEVYCTQDYDSPKDSPNNTATSCTSCGKESHRSSSGSRGSESASDVTCKRQSSHTNSEFSVDNSSTQDNHSLCSTCSSTSTTNMFTNATNCGIVGPQESISNHETLCAGALSDDDNMSSSAQQQQQQYFHTRRRRKSHVDVRMIDFAHSTYQGFRGDKKKHEGPDHGYLFGIENLITLFRELKSHSCSDDL